jgi:hypothetical protein
MLKSAVTVTYVVFAATLLFGGYALITSFPDLRRYIRISTM